jgi:hypothetical protein
MFKWLFGPSIEDALLRRLNEVSQHAMETESRRIALERAYFDLRRELEMQLGPKAPHVLRPHDEKMACCGYIAL